MNQEEYQDMRRYGGLVANMLLDRAFGLGRFPELGETRRNLQKIMEHFRRAYQEAKEIEAKYPQINFADSPETSADKAKRLFDEEKSKLVKGIKQSQKLRRVLQQG